MKYWPNASGSTEFAAASVSRTVFLSIFLMPPGTTEPAIWLVAYSESDLSSIRLIEYTTSSAVSVLPLWNSMPGRTRIVQTLPFFELNSSARPICSL